MGSGEAAIRGASERVIPILMTALVTALGLLPLAMGTGEVGQEIEGPMALVILGGLITSTGLNLLILPTLALRFGKFGKPAAEPAGSAIRNYKKSCSRWCIENVFGETPNTANGVSPALPKIRKIERLRFGDDAGALGVVLQRGDLPCPPLAQQIGQFFFPRARHDDRGGCDWRSHGASLAGGALQGGLLLGHRGIQRRRRGDGRRCGRVRRRCFHGGLRLGQLGGNSILHGFLLGIVLAFLLGEQGGFFLGEKFTFGGSGIDDDRGRRGGGGGG